MNWVRRTLFRSGEATVSSALGAALVVGAAVALGMFEPLEAKLLERLFELRGPTTVRAPITVVAIDEDTFDALGAAWPFPRRTHGEVLERLSAAGAVALGLDLIFSEPSMHGESDDDAFAESTQRVPGLVLGAGITTVSEGFYSKTDANLPLRSYRQTAAVGYVNLSPESDGVIR